MIDLMANRAPQVWHSLWLLFDRELLEKCFSNARSFLLAISSSGWSMFLSPLVISYLPKLECFSLVTPGLFGYRGELTGGPPWKLRSLNLRMCNILFHGSSLPRRVNNTSSRRHTGFAFIYMAKHSRKPSKIQKALID